MVFTFTNLYSYPIISIFISVALLLGLYEQTNGEIKVDGTLNVLDVVLIANIILYP